MGKMKVILFEGVIIILLGWMLYNTHHRANRFEHNYLTARDSIELIENDRNVILAEKNAYILKYSEISDLNASLKKRISYIQKDLDAKISQITELKSQVRIDTLIIETEKIKDTTHFKSNDPWFELEGKLKDEKLSLYNINVPVPLRYGITKDNRVFVESENPYIEFEDINSVIIDDHRNERKKRIRWSIQVGIGCQYGLNSRKYDFGPYLGYGLCIYL